MTSYGCDAPDLRFDMKIKDISDMVKASNFKVFLDVIKSGGQVRGLNATSCGNYSRKDIDGLTAFVGQFGAKGLAWFKVEETGLTSSITKFFSADILEKIQKHMEAKNGDLLLFVADKSKIVCQSLANSDCISAIKTNTLIPMHLISHGLWIFHCLITTKI